MSSAEFGKFIASETAKWGRVVKEARHQGAVTARQFGAPGSTPPATPSRQGMV